jgi:hypothetical protein
MSTALVGTVSKKTECAGEYKICVISVTSESASDTIAISHALHGVTYVDYIIGATITGGMDADFLSVEATITSTTEITLTTWEADGTASDSWSTTTVNIAFLGH